MRHNLKPLYVVKYISKKRPKVYYRWEHIRSVNIENAKRKFKRRVGNFDIIYIHRWKPMSERKWD